MKTLTHAEMLSLPQAQAFLRKENTSALADYLVRRLCRAKLEDTRFLEPFCIHAPLGVLTIDEGGATLESKGKPSADLMRDFDRINAIEDSPPPDILTMAKHATAAVGTWAASGFETASKALFEARKALCQKCPHWDAHARKGLGKCQKCGCTIYKLKLRSESCPLKYW